MPAIDPKKIAEWKALVALATPGPWRRAHGYDDAVTLPNGAKDWEEGWVYGPGDVEVMGYAGCGSHDVQWKEGDRDLAIASAEAVPALLSDREELLALLREVDRVVRENEGVCALHWNVCPGPPDCRLAAFLGKE